MSVVLGALEIALGLFFALMSSRLATVAHKYNQRAPIVETPVWAYRLVFLLVGVVFIAFGALSIAGLIHYT